MHDRPVLLARIGAPHGVTGEVRVKSFTSDPLALADYHPLFASDGRRFEIFSARPSGTVLVVRFKGMNSREAVEALNGVRLYADRSSLPEVEDEDEFYAADLVGLEVVEVGGNNFGKVRALHDFGAGDIVEIDLVSGGQEMFAFTREIFPRVDLAAGTITINPPSFVSERNGGAQGQ
jgi:16S rRNA processing protein RimM